MGRIKTKSSGQNSKDDIQSLKRGDAKTKSIKRVGLNFWLIIISIIIFVFILLAIIPQTSRILFPFFSQFTESPIISTDEGRYCIAGLGVFATTLLTAAMSSISKKNEEDHDSEKLTENITQMTKEKERYPSIQVTNVRKRIQTSKKLIYIIGFITLCITIIFALMLITNLVGKNTDVHEIIGQDIQTESPNTNVTSDNKLETNDESVLTEVTLSASDNITYHNFEEAKQIIGKRIELLAGDCKYNIRYESSKIAISMPLELFNGMDLETTILACISRPLRLYIAATNDLVKIDSNEITRNMIEDAEVVSANSIEADIEEQDFEITSNQFFLKLTLTHDGASLVNEFIEQKEQEGMTPRFALDLAEFKATYVVFRYVKSDADQMVFYLTNLILPQKEVYESLAYSLMNDPLSDSFQYSIKLSPEADWESIGETKNIGVYQTDKEEITGNTILMNFNRSSDDITEGEKIDQRVLFLERLDALETPYCFGFSYINPNDYVVDISTDKIGPDIMALLVSNYLSLTSSTRSIYDPISVFFKDVTIKQDSSGYYYLQLTINDYLQHEFQAETQTLAESNGQLYLCTDDGVILSCNVSEVITDGKINLDRMPHIIGQEGRISKEYLFILKLIQTIINQSWSGSSLEKPNFTISKADPSGAPPTLGIPHINEEDTKIEEALKNINPLAEMYWDQNDTQSLNVLLHGEVAGGFIKCYLDEVEQIFDECDLDNSSYTSIVFQLVDEEGFQRLRLLFNKNYNTNIMDCTGLCRGDIFELYYDEFRTTAEKNAFYQQRNFTMYQN